MILGVGNDIVDIRRIEKLYLNYGVRLSRLIFTKNEWDEAILKAKPSSFLAKRFAVKEAFVKAAGTGFGQEGNMFWRDIEVKNNPLGQPFLNIMGNALMYLNKTAKSRGAATYSTHISLSDEYPYAMASVIISLEK